MGSFSYHTILIKFKKKKKRLSIYNIIVNKKIIIKRCFFMKKIILVSFFLLSILSFSRYIERCKVLDNYKCKSLSSGKIYHFNIPIFMGNNPFRGTKGIVKVTFNGNGYQNLDAVDWELVE